MSRNHPTVDVAPGAWSVRHDANGRSRLPRDLALLVLDRMKIGAWDRFLFVECGDGWVVEEVWRRVVRGYACGVDRSPTLVDLATRLRGVPGKVEFKTWDGRRLPCPDRAFERVVAIFALARRADSAALLRELQRVVRPEGDVYLLELACLGDGGPEDAPDAELRRLLEQAGFNGIRELTRSEATPAPGEEPQTAVLVHARATPPAGQTGRPAARA